MSFTGEPEKFPVELSWIRNEEHDNSLDLDDGTEITVTVAPVGTPTGVMTLSYIPNRPSIMNPAAGEEWALQNLENTTSGEGTPGTGGDYTEIMRIDSVNYATKVVSYTVEDGAIGNWDVGDKVLFYNPHADGSGWAWENDGLQVISKGGGGWRDDFINAGPIFRHSDGAWVMLVSGNDGSTPTITGFTIGAAKSSDLVTWAWFPSDAAIFSPGGTDWRQNGIRTGHNILKMPDDSGKHVVYAIGADAANDKSIGWIKFDENFSAPSLEYADTALFAIGGDQHREPAGVFHNGIWRVAYRLETASGIGDNVIVERTSTTGPLSGFSDETTIFGPGNSSNQGLWYSSHVVDFAYVVFRGKLYGLLCGASMWNAAGNVANNINGLAIYDDDTDTWSYDTRSPMWFNAVYAGTNLWGANYNWQADHYGGRHCPVIHNTKMYVPNSCTLGTDEYQIGMQSRTMN